MPETQTWARSKELVTWMLQIHWHCSGWLRKSNQVLAEMEDESRIARNWRRIKDLMGKNANAVLKENCLFQDSVQSNSQEMVELGGELHFLAANIWAVPTFRLFRGGRSISPDLFISPKTNFPPFQICFPLPCCIFCKVLIAWPACLIIDGEEGHLKSIENLNILNIFNNC